MELRLLTVRSFRLPSPSPPMRPSSFPYAAVGFLTPAAAVLGAETRPLDRLFARPYIWVHDREAMGLRRAVSSGRARQRAGVPRVPGQHEP
jgi:hypothetical protein